MDFGKLFNTLLDLVVDLLMLIPKFINWALVQLIDLLLAIMPSSASLGIPTIGTLLGNAAGAFPFFPWSVVAQALSITLPVLTGVLIWKAVDLLWP
ncbi:hypothetical protein D3C87_1173970 [compost metagenome]